VDNQNERADGKILLSEKIKLIGTGTYRKRCDNFIFMYKFFEGVGMCIFVSRRMHKYVHTVYKVVVQDIQM
jgi:hypothetical protein